MVAQSGDRPQSGKLGQVGCKCQPGLGCVGIEQEVVSKNEGGGTGCGQLFPALAKARPASAL